MNIYMGKGLFKLKFADLWDRWGTTGVKLPHLNVPGAPKPSASALWAYVSWIMAVGSVLAYHFSSTLLWPTLVTIGFFALCVVLSLFKTLSKAKFDLDDKSVELEQDTKAEEPK